MAARLSLSLGVLSPAAAFVCLEIKELALDLLLEVIGIRFLGLLEVEFSLAVPLFLGCGHLLATLSFLVEVRLLAI